MPTLINQIEPRVSFRENGCWDWIGYVNPLIGYGYFRPSQSGPNLIAHRMIYEYLVEPVPGLLLHHLCENRTCVNPDHLQPVTQREHARLHSSAECVKCGANDWWISKRGWRRC